MNCLDLAPVFQKQDCSAIQRINHYPVDKGNQLLYLVDRDLFAG